MPSGYTYILGSASGTLYIGVSSNIYTRILQHRQDTFEGFSKKYSCTRLLYFEHFSDILTAIAREKQLKGWRREKKLNLVRSLNPGFKDLSELWGSQMIGPDESIREYTARQKTAHL